MVVVVLKGKRVHKMVFKRVLRRSSQRGGLAFWGVPPLRRVPQTRVTSQHHKGRLLVIDTMMPLEFSHEVQWKSN